MKTDDLIALLATGDVEVAAGAVKRRLGAALALGAAIGVVMMWLALGLRPDIVSAMQLPMFWVKLGFVVSISVGALLAAARVARPGVPLGWAPYSMAAPVFISWMMAAIVLINLPADERLRAAYGQSWFTCPFLVAVLSVPAFVALFWAMRELAPTRLRLAGAIAGLLAGGVGATIYSFHCEEMAVPFLGVWYVLGILIPGAVGAALGPRLLRW